MNYEEWKKLNTEQQSRVSDNDLPEIPSQMLRNGLIHSKAVRQNGVMGWQVTQQTKAGTTPVWLPEIKTQQFQANGETINLYHKLDPTTAVYIPQISETETPLSEEPVGKFGTLWMQWMEENYPEKVEWMMLNNRYLTVARSVEQRTREYMELLDRQYQQTNPRPVGNFNAALAWEQEKQFLVENQAIRDEVYRAVTTP
ncbi:MAG: TnpV protein [Oscillospiraceae bacterium]|nr:TnpV protein [Oscillospiraceae bacterium]